MDKLKNYLFFNPHYHKLSKNELLFQYKNDLNIPSVIKSFQHFHQTFPHFNLNFYKHAYKDLNNKNNQELSIHWINFGQYNNYISNILDFYKCYKDFDYTFYNLHYQLNLDIEEQIIFHYLNEGRFKHYFINKFEFDQSKQNHSMISNVLKVDNQIDNNQKNDNNNLIKKKVYHFAHVFVHMFKIGGGEIYLYHLLNYFKIHYAHFKHSLFLNKNYENNPMISFDIPIIYYDNYDELKELLFDFDIIFDNQLYHFHLFNYYHYKTIQIIHSCSIYQKDIQSFYLYSIHLYHEKSIHDSWSLVIKNINYLSINHLSDDDHLLLNNKLDLIQNHQMNDIYYKICIIGNINPHKFPILFLKKLLSFLNVNKKYIFNIYGVIEPTYEMFFLNKIKKCKNINYCGVIEHSNIKSIYLEHYILLSPSLSEAGATVILEAMLYGCLIICRNSGGNKETINHNSFFLAENDDDYFKIIDKISNLDKSSIINNINHNYFKILKHHNHLTQFNSLYHYTNHLLINQHHVNSIPNNVHYIYGLKEQKEEFPFLFYFGILSNIIINKPIIIYFHYHFLPYGYWWDKIKKHLTLNYISNIQFEIKKSILIEHFAHKSDYLRLLLLEKYGGIYYDIDTICIHPHNDLLKYDCVLGIQEKFKNKDDLLGNAVIFSKKNNIFIQKWLKEYEDVFDNNDWTSASLFLPTKIYNDLDENEKKYIHIVDKYHFYYPNYNENHLLFQHSTMDIHDKSITYHYCNHYSIKYLELINKEEINYLKNNQCLMSKILNNIFKYNHYDKNIINDDQTKIIKLFKNILNKHDKNKIYLLLNENNIEEILYSLNQIEYLFYYSLNIYIISNTITYDFFKSIVNKFIFLKYIDIYLFESFEKLNQSIQFNIIHQYHSTHMYSLYYVENNTILEKNIDHLNSSPLKIYIKHIYSNN